MRHKVDEFCSLRRNASGSCRAAPSDRTSASMASNPNQNSRLCLPLLSETQKVIWVYSDQMNLQLDGVVELDAAFDRFPYLTQKQTLALAKRCSLHPDQVRVWFMAQRLRYGISWDYKDIREMQRRLTRSLVKEETNKKVRRNEKKGSKKVKESGEEVKNDTKVDPAGEDKKNAKKRQKKTMKEKKTKQGNEKEGPASIQTQNNLSTAEKKTSKPRKRSHPDTVLVSGPDPKKTPSPTSEIPPVLESVVRHRNTNVKSSTKTWSQLATLRSAFCTSQYPDTAEYNDLVLTTGLQHRAVVGWFRDTRYRLKKFKPLWMNQEQRSRVLANIRYQQYLRTLEKTPGNDGNIKQSKTEEEKMS